ncbi:unnamed protein product [Penicillium olsonii]|nr:unnamed protein product [Penicillium olsonii]
MVYGIWTAKKAPYTLSHDLRGADWSSQDPVFAHDFFSNFNNESRWKLRWSLDWNSCNEEGFEKMQDGARMNYNSSSSTIWFTIKNSSQEVDQVAASTEKTCPGESGVMLNVTGETMTVPRDASWSNGKFKNGTCAVVASMPSSTPDPCQVEIGRSLYSNTTAALKDRLCRQFDPPADCPKKNTNAAQQLAVAGMSCLLVVFGALRYLLI